MTKQELIEKAKMQYFDGNKSIDLLLASEDGHFFLPQAKNYALNHVSGKNMELFEITRQDVEGKVEELIVEDIKVKEEVSTEVEASSKPEVTETVVSESKPKTKPKTRRGNKR